MYVIEEWSDSQDKWVIVKSFVNEMSAEVAFSKIKTATRVRLIVTRTLREKWAEMSKTGIA